MGRKLEEARQLDALASAAPTFAEAQALRARADYLRRRAAGFFGWSALPLIRN